MTRARELENIIDKIGIAAKDRFCRIRNPLAGPITLTEPVELRRLHPP